VTPLQIHDPEPSGKVPKQKKDFLDVSSVPAHDKERNCTETDQGNQRTKARLCGGLGGGGYGGRWDGGYDRGDRCCSGCNGCRDCGWGSTFKNVEQLRAGCSLVNCGFLNDVLVGFERGCVNIERDLVQTAVALRDFDRAGCAAELTALALLSRLE